MPNPPRFSALLPPTGSAGIIDPSLPPLTCSRAVYAPGPRRGAKTKPLSPAEKEMARLIVQEQLGQRAAFAIAFEGRAREMATDSQARAAHKIARKIAFERYLKQLREDTVKSVLMGSPDAPLKPWSRADKRLLLRQLGEGRIPGLDVKPSDRIAAVKADNAMTGDDGGATAGAGPTWNFNFYRDSPLERARTVQPAEAVESQ